MSYSTLINWLKVLLPLLALGLLSTVFLIARDMPEEVDLPFLEEIRNRAEGADGMRGPFYSGITEAGDTVSVRADMVRPDPTDPGRALASNLEAHIAFEDGSELDITSLAAEYSDSGETLRLTDDVVLISSNGYEMRTQELLTHIDTANAESPGDVEATGPAGTITAGGLRIRSAEGTDGEAQLVFTDGVKLVYVPKRSEE